MPTTPDYRALLNEKFNTIHVTLEEKFNSVNKQLTSIEEQTKKTNGRVIKLEEKVTDLEKKDLAHSINCPKTKQFDDMTNSIILLKDDIDKKLQDVSFFIRNPKLGLAIIVATVLFTIFSYSEFRNYITQVETKIESTK